MHKQSQDTRYLYWTVMCTVLQVRLRLGKDRDMLPDNPFCKAKEPTTSPAMRTLLFKLAHRLLESSTTPSYLSSERFCLHLSVLREIGMYEEAQKHLDGEVGKIICSASLVCNQIRRDIWRLQGRALDEGRRAELKSSEK